ncbi:ankyrin repeat-containing domain protein [Lipomyces orientalis]|uniref:Ankyrin repeat-containing domain protein n=1 Tax=Lipomyces orientalis TaxID=1233043 RepID=A0ACC3TKK5_9ASCO
MFKSLSSKKSTPASSSSSLPLSKTGSPVPSDATSATLGDSDGAKPSELLIEASRRNNIDLLQEVLGISVDGEARPGAAEIINSSVDALGNTPLHVAALNGSYECLDMLLDVEGVEVDPVNRMEGNTPLHCAVVYAEEEPEHAIAIVDMLVDAGCDPRIRNKQKDKPIDLVLPTNPELRKILQGAEMAAMMGPTGEDQEVGQDVEDSGSESE